MKPIILRTRGDDGVLDGGHVIVRTGERHASIQTMVVDMGLAAVRSLPEGSARRREIAEWLNEASDNWPLEPGEYPLAGRAAIVIDTNDVGAAQRIREQEAYARALRVDRPSPLQSTPKSSGHSDAIAKARAALTPSKAHSAFLAAHGR
jgi:hypothetical protein